MHSSLTSLPILLAIDPRELVLAHGPIAISLLVAWVLARKGRITLALLAGVGLPILLWLALLRWQYPHPTWCPYDSCPFGPYIYRVVNDHLLFSFVVLPMGLALAPTQFLIRRGKAPIGMTLGVITMAAYWATLAWASVDACNKCRIYEPTCCELVGLGLIFYGLLAVVEILGLLLIGFVWSRTLRRREAPQPTDAHQAA